MSSVCVFFPQNYQAYGKPGGLGTIVLPPAVIRLASACAEDTVRFRMVESAAMGTTKRQSPAHVTARKVTL
ncbi:hypothetical protein DPMN_033247 [Dreissena polymorpha]|uniref:Uncharacterized protein n=1 Tax=Dreissena polymorpha TaxID=45954 RepID=A0A9D4M3B2_DREPO|nr:hypothetical protein DPMN_033247 [Dreissena polymorpha]